MTPIYDEESTGIYKHSSETRFDRFYASMNLLGVIYTSSEYVGSANIIDVVRDDSKEYLLWFEKNISDHFPVVMTLVIEK